MNIKKDSIYVCKIKNITLEKDTSIMYFYPDANGFIRDINYYYFLNDFGNKSTLEYDSLGIIKSLSETRTGMGITYTTKTNITPNISRRGIFRDINFTAITKVTQLGNVLLILADQNPSEIISSINVEDKTRTELTTIEYKYDKQDYPTKITLNNVNKASPITILNIKYIKLNN